MSLHLSACSSSTGSRLGHREPQNGDFPESTRKPRKTNNNKYKTKKKKKENIHSPTGSSEVGSKDRAGFSCRGQESVPGTEVGQRAGTAKAATLAKDQWCP